VIKFKLSEEEYRAHTNDYDGFCTECQEFTRVGATEPDATGYECPQCELHTCLGAEEALIEGLLEFT
jgi:hypothetical protein